MHYNYLVHGIEYHLSGTHWGWKQKAGLFCCYMYWFWFVQLLKSLKCTNLRKWPLWILSHFSQQGAHWFVDYLKRESKILKPSWDCALWDCNCLEAEGWPELGLGLLQVVELRLGLLLVVASSALEIPKWLFKNIDMFGFLKMVSKNWIPALRGIWHPFAHVRQFDLAVWLSGHFFSPKVTM